MSFPESESKSSSDPAAAAAAYEAKARQLEALPRAARRHYYLASAAVVLATTALLLDIFVLSSGGADAWWSPPPPLSRWRKAALAALVLFAMWTHVSLGGEHRNYAAGAARGCAPAPVYPRDAYGVRHLLETARALRQHRLLPLRAALLRTLGHTHRHRTFPSSFDIITTDDPENAKAILAQRFDDWALPAIRIQGFLPVLGKNSIFTTNGAAWQHSRTALRPAFVRDQISDLACFDRHIQRLLQRLPRDGSPVDLQAMFLMLTADTISDFMLGQSTDMLGAAPADGLRFGRYFDASMQKISTRARLGWLAAYMPDRELAKYTRFMREYIDRYVSEARARQAAGGRNGDDNKKRYVFLEELIKSGEPDSIVRDQLLSIFLAGRDTTTSLLSYMFLQLSQRPDVVDRIRAEIADLGVQDPSWEQLRGMRYLNFVIKESLRLSPPVPTNQREAVRDTVLPVGGGPDGRQPVYVPKGTMVGYQVWAMQRRADIWGPDGDEFRPERWGEDRNRRVTYEYIPFNAGPRICIGQQFALAQVAMVAFRLLQAFAAVARRDDRPPTQRLGLNLSMLHGCWVGLTPAA
ncbi:cytochrome P450 [Xylariaceae sp. FL0804]|nr:cytochrome P450 [Xylariaceae sp. FL0804]